MAFSVQELADWLHAKVVGDPAVTIDGAESLATAGPGDLGFVHSVKNIRQLVGCRAGAVLMPEDVWENIPDDRRPACSLIVGDAQAAFIQVLRKLRPQRPRPRIGISPAASIARTAIIGRNCNIHAGATICEDVVIGDNCDIYPGVYVGPGCQLGDNVTVHPNAVLYHDVILGNRVILHANAVLGADGFGYRFESGRFERIPHFGNVEVADDVEIGAATTIDRGMIGPTVIGEGTKLDNQVMIGHNCRLGKHNAFASQVGFAGSVSTGDYVRCAGQVGVADHVHLGDGCVLGAKAGVHKDMPGGQTFIGTPATPEQEQYRLVMAMRRLPEMRRQLKELTAQVAELTDQLSPQAAPPLKS